MNINTYIRGNSLYHRFDSRAKLVFTILMCVVIFFVSNPFYLISLAIFSLVLSFFTVGKSAFKNLFLIFPVLIFMIIFLPFQSMKGDALLQLKGIVLVSDTALNNFSTVASRFVFISLLTSLLLQSSDSKSLLSSLRFFRIPYNICLTISLSLHFIPTIASAFSEIRESQSLRLPNPDTAFEKKGRIRKLIPSLTSLLVYAIKSIPLTAAALEMRGFGRRSAKREYYVLDWNVKIFLQLLISILIPFIILSVLR